jgi:hypothetical protein
VQRAARSTAKRNTFTAISLIIWYFVKLILEPQDRFSKESSPYYSRRVTGSDIPVAVEG